MKRSSLRGFGIACLLIGIIYTGVDQFFPSAQSVPDEKIAKYKEKIAQLETKLDEANQKIEELENGSTITEENEVVSEEQVEETEPNESSSEEVQAEPTNENQDGEVVEGVLYIYAGLTPYEVSKKLQDMGIIQNAIEMELFLAQPEYSRSIQKGQFQVNSSMTIEEIANLITGKTKQ